MSQKLQSAHETKTNLGAYSLKGLINHEGSSLEKGHYFSLVKRLDRKWWFCNDSDVRCLG